MVAEGCLPFFELYVVAFHSGTSRYAMQSTNQKNAQKHGSQGVFATLRAIKWKKKSSTVKVLNVDKFVYCKPKGFCSRNIALGLDPLQIDTPCAPVFKSKALSINKVEEEIINSKGA